MRLIKVLPSLLSILLAAGGNAARASTAPSDADFGARESGVGPYETLIIRGAYLIDGLGGPTEGPTKITVRQDRIAKIEYLKPDDKGDGDAPDTRVLDATGMYVLPGFINGHGHLHSVAGAEFGHGGKIPSEYVARLWLAHGITTVREVGNGRPMEWIADVARRSEANEILAPRIFPHVFFPTRGLGGDFDTPEAARAYVRKAADTGIHGIKFFDAPANILKAAIAEAKLRQLKTTMHHAQTAVAQFNVLDTSAIGLDSMEHWYGLPEALFSDRIIQDYPPEYIYNDEQDRFREAGRLWAQAAAPGSRKWNEVMDTLLDREFHIIPTFTVYVANRDWMRARNADWNRSYTLPQLWDFFRPSLKAHGSYWYDWTQDNELDWRENFAIWMKFINEYKNRGGIVGVGEDAGYIYNTYGFGFITELELMREAGFNPLEVIQAATINNARILGVEDMIGSVEVGKKADLVIVPENPLQNLKTLYLTGHIRMDRQTGQIGRVGGVAYTIKDGIIYDIAELKQQLLDTVAAEKRKRGLPAGYMPIVDKE